MAIVALVLGDVYAGYRAICIDGIRAIERDRITAQQVNAARETTANRLLALVVNQPDRRVAGEGIRGLLLEQRARYLALAEHAEGVHALDPGIKKARQTLVSALLHDAHDLDHLAAAPIPSAAADVGRHFTEVDALLDKERRQWGLDPLAPAPPPDANADPNAANADPNANPAAILHAAADELAQLERPYDEPVDATVLLIRNDDISLLNLRNGQETTLVKSDGFWSTALGNGFVAVNHQNTILFIDADDPSRRTTWHGGDDANLAVRPAADRDSVWIQDHSVPGQPVLRVDREGQVKERRPATGFFIADLGNGGTVWLDPIEDEDEDQSHYRIERPGRPEYLCACELLSPSPRALLWADGTSAPHVSDLDGRVLFRLDNDPLGIRDASLSPDGTRLAVGWYDGRLEVIDVATAALVSSVRTPGVESIIWTPAGDRLFFTVGTSHGWYRIGDQSINYLRLRRSGTGLLGVF